MEDYDKGKPLTARRILAVKEAIDADGTAKARSATIRFETIDNPANKAAMLAKGYTKAELPRLARAARFYAEVNHCAEFEALEALTTPGSKANRLMQYGGRFLESAANFANGLRLMDSFASWFTAVCETKAADRGEKFENAKTFTDFNFAGSIASRNAQAGLERIVFEELAVNPGANLAETDPEKIFGMKDNAASRFIGTRRYGNFLGVVVSVPPARRGAIFAVFDKLSKPLPETKEAALAFNELPLDEKCVRDPNLVISRILRHLPEIEKLMAKGALTTKNIVKTLFPDLPSRDWTLRGVYNPDFTPKGQTRRLIDAYGIFKGAWYDFATAPAAYIHPFNIQKSEGQEKTSETVNLASGTLTWSTTARGIAFAIDGDGYVTAASTKADKMIFSKEPRAAEKGQYDRNGSWIRKEDALLSGGTLTLEPGIIYRILPQ